MGAFIKGFLLEDPRRLMGAQGVQLFLAAFGKHPGWEDHIEDIGLETESLALAKQNLYVNGIGRQIDSAAWEKLGEADALATFKHNFLWSRGGQFLIGRMWSSSDGKGRTRYPMVVVCHGVQLPLGPAAKKIVPLLMQLELACKGVKTAAEVQSVMAQSLNQLRFAVCDLGSDTQQGMAAAPVTLPGLAPDDEGLCRVMYQVQSHMGAFARGRFSIKADDASLRPQHIRVPIAPQSALDSLLFWNRLLDTALDPAAPRLFLAPDGEAWLDMIVGEPTDHEFFCLRAAPKALPLASEVPYNLEPAFRERTQKLLIDLRDGKIASPETDTATRTSTTSFTQRWFKGGKKWFGAASLLGVGAAGVLGWWAFSPPNKREGIGRAVPSAPPAAPTVAATPAKPQPPSQPEPTPLIAASAGEPKPVGAIAPASTSAAPAKIGTAPSAVVADAGSRGSSPSPAISPSSGTSSAPPTSRVSVTASAPAAPAPAATPKAEHPSKPLALAAVPDPASAPLPRQAREPPLRGNLTNAIGMELVWLPNGFWAGRYEVTQGEYAKVMGSNPSRFKGPRQPVENVTWHDAMNFCKKLTEMDDQAGSLPEGAHYTLPTEKQWEALIGRARLANGHTSQTTPRKSTVAVNSAGTNQLGLYGVLGNVWEWCLDDAGVKPLKGAAYNTPRTQDFEPVTETTALKLAPDARFPHTGFRCVLMPAK